VGHGGPGQVETESGNESVAPGERFAGVVGVEAAEFEGELEARTFGQRVAAAKTNESAAGVLAEEVESLEDELAALDAEIRELEQAHENGSVGEGQYRARLAKLLAQQRALQRQINQTEYVAEALPAEALEAKGVNVTAIETLRSQASEMTGPEVAAVARSIAGKNAGKGMGGPPDEAGPPAFVQNRTGGPPADAGPGTETGPPEDAGPDNETGPPEDTGPGNETGPPDDAGSGNETGPPEDAGQGNETGPPEDAGQGNETGAPEDAGQGNETGAPEDAGQGNETGAPEDAAQGNETGAPEDAGQGNETGQPDGAGQGNETGPSDDPGQGNETGPPDNGAGENGTDGGDAATGAEDDSGDDDADGAADAETLRAVRLVAEWR